MESFTKYRNPWYTKSNQLSKEYYYLTHPMHQKIEEYKSFYIINGVNPWIDVVEYVQYDKDNDEFVCVTQRGSVRNAKEYIDQQYEE